MVKATRLRYISSPSPEGLEIVLNTLSFKVEIKSVTHANGKWWCWFVLPDNISHDKLGEQISDKKIEFSSIEIEDF